MNLVNIGFRNYTNANRIVTVVSPDSHPIKRIVKEARDRGMLVDATYGRRTRSVIITDSDQVILSAIAPKTINERIAGKEEIEEDPEEEEALDI